MWPADAPWEPSEPVTNKKGQETQCLAHKTIDSQGSFLLAKVLNVV